METIANLINIFAELRDMAKNKGLNPLVGTDHKYNEEEKRFGGYFWVEGYHKSLRVTTYDGLIVLNDEKVTIDKLMTEINLVKEYLEFENAI